ncbi:5069_t:CDS:2 [Ambispora gerdemannii]|uniref:5069_t:CDS:1 n=1 Tax=Ambispora gerdemannii TaxID=144530 RepID=A0A9N9CKX5_9GLOM|nr:5069_t:CDS:2 [Ambispora gerdemannii]
MLHQTVFDSGPQFIMFKRPVKLQMDANREIGYFDSKTRDLSVKTGFTVLQLEKHSWLTKINIGAPPSKHKIISINIEYPSSTGIFFKPDYKIYGKFLEVLVTIEGDTG